jgi:hypothetical protein
MYTNLTNIFADFSGSRFKDHFGNEQPALKNIVNTIYKNSHREQGPWIAGGMGRQLAVDPTCQEFADIDVWFNNATSYEQCVNRLNFAFGNTMYETFNSSNARTYTVGDYKVQLIRRAYYETLDDVFANFDFTCCQVAVDKDFKLSGPGIDDARNNVLKVNKLDRRGFLARYAKYVGYGYVMPNGEFLDIINNEDINYEFDATTLGY